MTEERFPQHELRETLLRLLHDPNADHAHWYWVYQEQYGQSLTGENRPATYTDIILHRLANPVANRAFWEEQYQEEFGHPVPQEGAPMTTSRPRRAPTWIQSGLYPPWEQFCTEVQAGTLALPPPWSIPPEVRRQPRSIRHVRGRDRYGDPQYIEQQVELPSFSAGERQVFPTSWQWYQEGAVLLLRHEATNLQDDVRGQAYLLGPWLVACNLRQDPHEGLLPLFLVGPAPGAPTRSGYCHPHVHTGEQCMGGSERLDFMNPTTHLRERADMGWMTSLKARAQEGDWPAFLFTFSQFLHTWAPGYFIHPKDIAGVPSCLWGDQYGAPCEGVVRQGRVLCEEHYGRPCERCTYPITVRPTPIMYESSEFRAVRQTVCHFCAADYTMGGRMPSTIRRDREGHRIDAPTLYTLAAGSGPTVVTGEQATAGTMGGTSMGATAPSVTYEMLAARVER